jgi:dTMP kinase
MGLAFQEKARAGFLSLAKAHPRFRVIDADGTPETVAARAWAAVAPALP